MNCCRTCLSRNDLNKIFLSNKESIKCSKVLLKATGLKIEMNDGFSQHMCTVCINFVNQYLSFRKTCKQSYKSLIERIKIKSEPCDTLQDNHVTPNVSKKKKNSMRNDTECKTLPITNINGIEDNSSLENNDFSDNIDQIKGSNLSDINNSDIDNYDYDVTVTIDRNESPIANEIRVFEATIEDMLRKPKDIVFENKKLNKKIKLGFNQACKETKMVKKDDLKRDVESEPVECKYCHKIVKSQSALIIHYKIHTGRNIVCEHCGKKFTSKRRLLIHCKGRHGYKKTDKCTYCDYRGSSLEMVKIHERLHTGERPYICACGAAFHRRSSYLQHVPIHQPEKTVPCDECPALFKSVTLMKIHKNRHKSRRRKQLAAASDPSA